MPVPILATKLYIPSPRTNVVTRPRLIERLNLGANHKLTLISAPAGFGKSTLLSEWVVASQRERPTVRVAWLSLDEGDNDPARFLTYFIAAVQTVAPSVGHGVLAVLQSPQPPPMEPVLTTLLNQIASVEHNFVFVLDDFHMIEAKPLAQALLFVLEHLPPQMRLVIATREDPDWPLARWRAQHQLTELRAADLRFEAAEAAEFLNQVMGLALSAENVAALEARTEGWIAGLQLAALSMQGHPNAANFIQSFTGNHRFIMDYLVEEVLHRQPEAVQTFLLRTSILERLCGPLCEAVVLDAAVAGQATLKQLEQANLFLIPLDNERQWYRYHHLFAELLRQRLKQTDPNVEVLHLRASEWCEAHGLEREAFQHAVAAKALDRAATLAEGRGTPLIYRGAFRPVLNWLESLPTATLNQRPELWVLYASALMIMGQLNHVEQKLQAAEAALAAAEPNAKVKDLIGQIAALRASIGVGQYQVEAILAQSRRALAHLHPNNLPVRTSATFSLGYAHQLQGNRAEARRAFSEVLAISQKIGNNVNALVATIGLGNLQEADNQPRLAAETYGRVLQTLGEPTLPVGSEAHLGLARIFYEWNDLPAAAHHAQRGAQLARQFENSDRFIVSEAWLARVKLAQGELGDATQLLAQTRQASSLPSFWLTSPEVFASKILHLIRLGNLAEALQLAQTQALPLYEAQIYLAQGKTSAALALLEATQLQAEAKGWPDVLLSVKLLQATAQLMEGAKAEALRQLSEVLAQAEPEGFIRLFVDKGPPVARLLVEAAAAEIRPHYVGKLLAAFENLAPAQPAQTLIEPLSSREREVLLLMAQGHSNEEIGQRLFLALSTIKGHNQRIFEKLHVQRRAEAVARARALGLL